MNEEEWFERSEYLIIDLDALFNCNIHWMLLKNIFREDFFYALKLCFVYLFYGSYVLSENLSPYLDPFNLDVFINQNILEFLKLKNGKKYFCTSMGESICKKIFQDYSSVFDGYLCSTRQSNLAGMNKLFEIQALINGESLFYIGSSKADLNIWMFCNEIGLVIFKNSDNILKKIKKLNKKYTVLYAL